jgi:hypothetical protein
MSKSQKNLIGLLLSFFGFVLLNFRKDLFLFSTRPGLKSLWDTYLADGLGAISLILLFFFAFKSLGKKGLWGIGLVFIIELMFIGSYYYGPYFFPQSIKKTAFGGFLRGIAWSHMPLVQFDENCAQYDSLRFYTLKPGKSSFSSYEFKNSLEVNKMGFRDTETALIQPEVVFLGDSYTMGWGVEKEQRFSEVFSKLSGLKSLNTGISSYGTARELANLRKLDLSKTKVLFLQYHETDIEENAHYIKNRKLGNKTPQDFEAQIKYNKKLKRYWPLKYSQATVLSLINLIKPKPASPAQNGLGLDSNSGYEKDLFAIIKEMRQLYNGPIILTYIGSFYTEPKVIQFLASKNTDPNVHFVDMSKALNETDYFFFDLHINAAGHKKVAQSFFKIFQDLKI